MVCLVFPGAVALGKPLRVVVITDAAGLGDRGFNDVCWRGVEKAREELGLEAQFLQSREQADYVSNLTLAAKRADVIVTLGYLFVDAVQRTAPRFPHIFFVHMEGEISGENVACFDFKSEEGGFLAGLVAGVFTRSRKIGVVTGMDIPPVEAYVSGFRAGVDTAAVRRGEGIEVIVASAGSFNDPVKGKALAQALMGKGVDVIFRAAGNTGVGVMEAVKNSDGVYLIGEDLDQDGELPGKILTSTLKRLDVAVHGALSDIARGSFQPGHRWMGAQSRAVGITEMRYTRGLFRPEDLEFVAMVSTMVARGDLVVPRTMGGLKTFSPPNMP